MTTTVAWTVGATTGTAAGRLEVATGGNLTAPFAVTIASKSAFQVDAGGTYVHNNTTAFGSSIFGGATTTLAATSTVTINNSSTTGPSGITFGNLIINYTSDPGGSVSCAGALQTINGSLTIQSTSTREFRLAGTANYTLNVAGDLIISGGVLTTSSSVTTNLTQIINIGGNFNQSGGTFKNDNGLTISSVTFNGPTSTFTQSAGSFDSGNGQINFSVNAGKSLTLSNDFPVGVSRTLTNSGTLNCNGNNVTGAGAYLLAAGGTLAISSTAGITASGASGNIQTATRTFATGANYTYNGTSAQVTGSGLPATVNNLTNINSAGVTLSSGATVNGTLAATNGNFIANGNTLSADRLVGAGIITNGGTAITLTAGIANGTSSFGGVIAGGASSPTALTKSGTGTLTLTGNNTYTGDTTITAGVLAMGNSAVVLGNGTGNIILNGGDLQISTGNNRTVPNPITMAANSIVSGVSGVVSSRGTTAQFINFSTGTFVNTAGTLTVRDVGGGSGTLFGLRFTGGGFTFSSPISVDLNTDAGQAQLEFSQTSSAGAQTFSGVISTGGTGGGSVLRNSTGTTILTGANTYPGGSWLAGGFFGLGVDSVGTPPTLTSGPIGKGALNVTNGTASAGIFASGAAHTVGNAISFGALSNALTINGSLALTLSGAVTLGTFGQTLQVDNSADTTISGIIGGGPASGTGLTKTGAGKLILSGANSYTGDTSISVGTLQLGAGTAIPDGGGKGNVILASAATLNVAGQSETINGLSGSGTVDNSSGTGGLTVGNNNVSSSFSGTITNSGGSLGLTKTGTGTLTLSSVNYYSGKTAINGGTLSINAITRLGALPGSTVPDQVSLNGGTLQFTAGSSSSDVKRGFTLNAGGGTFDVSANQNLIIQGVVTGSGTLTKIGSGTLTLSSANTFTNKLIVNAGILSVDSVTDLGTLPGPYIADQVTIQNGATLQFTKSPSSSGSSRGFTLGAGGATLDISNTVSTTILASLVGVGNLIKISNGTLTLSGASTYAGTTTVSGGTLLVNGSLGGGAVTVQTGATLGGGGGGGIGGAVIVQAGGTLSPNGTLTLSNAPTLAGTVLMDIDRAVSTNNDQIVLTGGTLTHGGTLIVTNGGAAIQLGDSFPLFAASAFSGSYNAVTLPALASGLSWDTNNLAMTGGLDVYAFTTNSIQTMTANVGVPASLLIPKLLSKASSSRGTVTLAGVSSTSALGGTVTISNSAIVYTPPGSAGTDSFTYTLADGHSTITGTVIVTVVDPTAPTVGNGSNLQLVGISGGVRLVISGIAGGSYDLQYSTNLTSPTWLDLGTFTMPDVGLTNITDVSGDPTRYYRTLKQ